MAVFDTQPNMLVPKIWARVVPYTTHRVAWILPGCLPLLQYESWAASLLQSILQVIKTHSYTSTQPNNKPSHKSKFLPKLAQGHHPKPFLQLRPAAGDGP